MKKILILGAGVYQSRLITCSKTRGYQTHVASINGDYPGIEIADFFHPIDTTDEQGILELSAKLEIDGILTTGSDVCVPSIGLVVDKLGLHGTGRKTSKMCMDKRMMKEILSSAGVPTPDFEVVSSLESCFKAIGRIGLPCVIKAPDSSGSRGINTVFSMSEVSDAFEDSLSTSRCGELVVEEWVTGEEYGAQAIVSRSEVVGLMIHADTVTSSPRRIPVGHSAPHPNERSIFTETFQCVNKAVLASGIKNTISNVDLILTEKGPVIIEIAARMGGTCIPEVCGTWWGINLYEVALDLAIGNKISFPEEPMGVPNAAHLIWSDKAGKIRHLGPKETGLKWEIDVSLGSEVEAFTSGNLRVGDVSVSSDNVKKAEEYVAAAAMKFMEGLDVR
jgi:biotin carboxylase